jgi:hypothetical protein
MVRSPTAASSGLQTVRRARNEPLATRSGRPITHGCRRTPPSVGPARRQRDRVDDLNAGFRLTGSSAEGIGPWADDACTIGGCKPGALEAAVRVGVNDCSRRGGGPLRSSAPAAPALLSARASRCRRRPPRNALRYRVRYLRALHAHIDRLVLADRRGPASSKAVATRAAGSLPLADKRGHQAVPGSHPRATIKARLGPCVPKHLLVANLATRRAGRSAFVTETRESDYAAASPPPRPRSNAARASSLIVSNSSIRKL